MRIHVARILALLVLLLFFTSRGSGQTAHVEKVLIIEKGVYRAETIKKVDRPGTAAAVNTVQNPILMSATTSVPGEVGVRFGLRYVVVGTPRGSDIELKLVVNFPLGGLRNPDTGEVLTRSEHMVTVPIGAALYREYHLENAWEIVPGYWTFGFWLGDRKLAEQRFCVYNFKKKGGLPSMNFTACHP